MVTQTPGWALAKLLRHFELAPIMMMHDADV